MISLIVDHLYNNKNKVFIIIYGLLTLLILIIPIPFRESNNELFFNSIYYFKTYNNLIYEIFKLLIPIFVLILVSDHDKKYINNLITYKGRSYVIVSKILINSYLLFINILFITLSYYLVHSYFKIHVITNKQFYKVSYSLFNDSIIIMLYILLFVRRDNKVISYIVLILYLLKSMFFNNIEHIIFYYLIPFELVKYQTYKNSMIYQLIYIVTLIVVVYIKYLSEDLK